jgi:uncharacterized damage-inducible protein DinB
MTEVGRILHQHELVFSGDAWHGDPIWNILEGVSATAAASHPLPRAHSIWELVLHMTFWEAVVTRRLKGERAGMDEALNFPAVPAVTEPNWHATLDRLRFSNREFRETLARLDPSKIDELSAARKRTFYEEAHGAIQHSLYHAGQIALLKKASSTEQ